MNGRVEALVGRVGKLVTYNLLDHIKNREDPVPSFIKRNFISPDELAFMVTRSFDVDIRQFPKSAFGVPTINFASDKNMSNHMFYNLVRSIDGLPELPARKHEIPGLYPRPFRCDMSNRNTRRLLK